MVNEAVVLAETAISSGQENGWILEYHFVLYIANSEQEIKPFQMKYSLSIIFLCVGLLFIGCKKDEDPCEDVTCLNGGACVDGSCNCPAGYSGAKCEIFDDCFNVTCLNGGTCANGVCNCPPQYTGSDCGQQKTPTQIRFTRIVLDQWPPTDNGADWDGALCGGARPDIFLSLDDGTGEFVTTGVQSDAIPGTSYTFTTGFPASTSNVTNNLGLRLYDYDTGACAPSDFMGGLQGSIYNSSNGFPSSFRFNLASAEIDATIYVEYVF